MSSNMREMNLMPLSGGNRSLDEILHELKGRGYKAYFSLGDNGIYCMAVDKHVNLGDFKVDEFYKISKDDIVQYVFAITPNDGAQGTLVEDKAAFDRSDRPFLAAFLFNGFEKN